MVEKCKGWKRMNTKRDKIIASAEKLIAQYGFRKTTMEEIAAAAGMSKSAMYYYYKSKEDIFEAIIKKDSNEFKRKINEAVSLSETPQEKILHYIQARMQHLKEVSIYYTTLNDEYLDHYFFVEEARKSFYSFEASKLKMFLEEGEENNNFVIDDIEITIWMISTVIKGLEFSLLVKDSGYDSITVSEKIMNIIFRGLNS
jgi:AcrR family transcriptional regulator